jgi:uncharacterized membrane protein YraQ (UPF0718 family)
MAELIPEHALPGSTGTVDRKQGHAASRKEVIAIIAFILIAAIGLFVAKWYPYYFKGFHIAATHNAGTSIVSKHAAAPKGWQAAIDYSYQYLLKIWQALVVGMLLAAGVQVLLPRDWLLRVLGSGRLRPVALAGAASVPSMMCTCCSAPPVVAMAKSRAPVGATMAYWLGNPVLNPATIVFMGLVLGWRWAALRIFVGLALVLGTAVMAQRLFGDKDVPEPAAKAVTESATADARPVIVRFTASLAGLAIRLIPEYAVIVFALGAARAFLFPAISPSTGHAVWLVLVLAVTGTLFVIPTAGEIPIIQSFMKFGLGPAGAGALMLTLPAVSLPSLLMVRQAVPLRVLMFVTGSVIVSGLLTALLAAAFRL